MAIRLVAVALLIGVVVGCSRDGSSPDAYASPTTAGTLTVEPSGPGTLASASRNVHVNMQDACDPDTFNAVLGPGTCVRAGGVKFDDFISQLTRLARVGSWHFAPHQANARVGQEFLAINKGGEVHTFTEVEEFGGGIVPLLNELAKTPVVAPECQSLGSDDFVAPGGSYTDEIEEVGVEKYQCCIHPWMRLEVRISDK